MAAHEATDASQNCCRVGWWVGKSGVLDIVHSLAACVTRGTLVRYYIKPGQQCLCMHICVLQYRCFLSVWCLVPVLTIPFYDFVLHLKVRHSFVLGSRFVSPTVGSCWPGLNKIVGTLTRMYVHVTIAVFSTVHIASFFGFRVVLNDANQSSFLGSVKGCPDST